MTHAWFHIVVIGTDLAGLLYAVLAARAGYRVLVIGQGAQPNAYRLGPFVFLREPERAYGLSTSPLVARVFRDLALGVELRRRHPGSASAVQLVLPDARLDMVLQQKRWERAVERELPGALAGFGRFDAWAKEATARTDELLVGDIALPPTGLGARRTYKKAIAGFDDLLAPGDPWTLLGSDPRARVIGAAPAQHLTTMAVGGLPPWAVARLWTHLRAGRGQLPGGQDGLRKLLLRKLREQSSDYRPEMRADHLIVRRGRIQAVQLADRPESIGCELVVGNMAPRTVLAMVPHESRKDAFHAGVASARPTAYRMIVNLGVAPEVIPAGMASEAVIAPSPGADPGGVGLQSLWVSRPSALPGVAGEVRPQGDVLQVSAFVPARGALPTTTAAKRTRDRVLARLREVIPWLDAHLELIDVPALVSDPESGRPTLHADALTPVFDAALPGTLGVSPLSPQTAYKNLLLCGDRLYAGLGFEGACLAALQTMALTRSGVRLKSALRGERRMS